MTDPGVKAPLRKDRGATLPRVENFIYSDRFKEVNLVNRLYPDARTADLSVWDMPGGRGSWQDYTFDDVMKEDFVPANLGDSFGPTWTTHWFKAVCTVPDEWKGSEVRFRWDSGSEATLWSEDGKILQGLSSSKTDQVRTDYLLTKNYDGATPSLTLYVEMAANRIQFTNDGDLIDPPPDDMYFTVIRAEVSKVDSLVYKVTRDLEVLSQLSSEMPNDARGYSALFTANQMVNNIIADEVSGGLLSASDLADAYFAKGNGARAHNLAAIGHCHIDTAWLWPYSETKRKVARSWSSQLALMKQYPEFIFVASSAQQWAWLKQYYETELYNDIKAKVLEDNSKFRPVGGTWIEMDGNIPSGESFIRQFLHGQRWFQKELGVTCKEFWLPDTFGYSSQIPGMMRHVGLGRFITQKMSWNFVNKMPNHNFIWEGIDGSQIIAHFPPGDSYHMFCNVSEALYTVSNLEDKGRVSTSAYLFGYGDGGGGPTQDMIERLIRMEDTDGIPKMKPSTSDALFDTLEAEQDNFCKWTGELYLELHNGTYTSQAAMKQLCRLCEFKLRDAEFLLCVATAGDSAAASLLTSCLAQLDVAWKNVLLNQFHDVLPGSGIQIVYDDATELYNEVLATAQDVFTQSVSAMFGSGTDSAPIAFNTLQWPRTEVVPNGDSYTMASVPAFGYTSQFSSVGENSATVVANDDGTFELSNGLVRAIVSSTGQILSLTTPDATDRDVFKSADEDQLFGNRILLFDDEPVYWDAWDVMDYHLETEGCLNDSDVSTAVSITSNSDLRCSLTWGCKVGRDSTLSQEIILTADCPYVTFKTTVDWKENRKLLKVGFDTSIQSNYVTYDTQFGSLQRNTAVNTSWDSAKYEVCGHKFADISDASFGFSVLNDSKYGWAGRDSTITLSLLKSPKAPDPTCDMREHTFSYAILPHAESWQKAKIVQRSFEFNNPLTVVPATMGKPESNKSWIDVSGDAIIFNTFKPDEDGVGDIVIRLFESHGKKSTSTFKIYLPVTAVKKCDGMEVAGDDVSFTQEDDYVSFDYSLTPFSIAALRLSF